MISSIFKKNQLRNFWYSLLVNDEFNSYEKYLYVKLWQENHIYAEFYEWN